MRLMNVQVLDVKPLYYWSICAYRVRILNRPSGCRDRFGQYRVARVPVLMPVTTDRSRVKLEAQLSFIRHAYLSIAGESGDPPMKERRMENTKVVRQIPIRKSSP